VLSYFFLINKITYPAVIKKKNNWLALVISYVFQNGFYIQVNCIKGLQVKCLFLICRDLECGGLESKIGGQKC